MDLNTHPLGGFIPQELRSEAPIKLSVPDPTVMAGDVWVGHAINVHDTEVFTPIGALYYLLWSNQWARTYGVDNNILIVDKPLIHNGIDPTVVDRKRNEKISLLEKAIEHFDLDRTTILSWSFFQNNGEYDKEYTAYRAKITGALRAHSKLKEKLITSCIPDAYRKNPQGINYVIDEIAAIVYLSAMGTGLRFGHLNERKLDRRIVKLLEKVDFGVEEHPLPAAIYLRGDYSLTTQDPAQVLPPSKEHEPGRRVLLNDDIGTVRRKIGGASKFYRGWMKSILQLAGTDVGETTAATLADVSYEKLIKPFR